MTRRFAARLARRILKKGPLRSGATIVALRGDLGAGKTTFTQGFVKALGVKGRVTSPTFLLMRRYALKSRKSRQRRGSRFAARRAPKAAKVKGHMFKNVYHFDLYRIQRASDLQALEFNKIIAEPANIVLIEWPERLGKKKHAHTVHFKHGKNEKEREIRIKNTE
ncbi:tRNA (adenosine(37)-N6)-threonylcarbamoyltransferase complex ATPase subunit type 1 TsaE [Patescibacteria group bacterium]|nr:tRNA (adenosine(37)-N6)-threonylcarbamoyltransferase complex ATPase subunit type 1 TsaE [Patescibacteria group bacterium]